MADDERLRAVANRIAETTEQLNGLLDDRRRIDRFAEALIKQLDALEEEFEALGGEDVGQFATKARYYGLSIPEAIERALGSTSTAMSPKEIAGELRDGGVSIWADRPDVSIASVLSRDLKSANPRFERIERGKYWLRGRPRQQELFEGKEA